MFAELALLSLYLLFLKCLNDRVCLFNVAVFVTNVIITNVVSHRFIIEVNILYSNYRPYMFGRKGRGMI